MVKYRYVAQYKCEKCRVQMTFHVMMNSHGICPSCGNTDRGTVVRCTPYSVRQERRRIFSWLPWPTRWVDLSEAEQACAEIIEELDRDG